MAVKPDGSLEKVPGPAPGEIAKLPGGTAWQAADHEAIGKSEVGTASSSSGQAGGGADGSNAADSTPAKPSKTEEISFESILAARKRATEGGEQSNAGELPRTPVT